MLNYFVRDLSYFQSVRNNRDLNTGYIYDDEFSKIQNYINNKILPTINNLIGNKIHGIMGSDGYLLRNVGNKVTAFDRVKSSDIPNKTITFDRLSLIAPNSLVYCQNDNLIHLPCVAANTTLVNVANNCLFQKITPNNIRNNSIPATKVALGVLTRNHLQLALLNRAINGVVQNIKIIDQAISNVKIADKAIPSSRLATATLNIRNDPNLVFVRQDVTGLIDDLHIIKARHIQNNTVSFTHMFGNNRVLTRNCIPNGSLKAVNNSTINPYKIFAGTPITQAHIKDRSFTFRAIQNAGQGIKKSKLHNDILQKLITAGCLIG